MDKTQREPRKLQKLALIREILLPSIVAGAALKTTTGEPVTLEYLPSLMSAGLEVCLINEESRLAAVTAVDNDPAGNRSRPTFTQIRSDGQLIKFFLWDQEMQALAINGYEPAILRLADDLFNVQRDDRGNLLRLNAGRAFGVFNDRMIRA